VLPAAVDELTGTTGIVALSAAGVALVALVLAVTLGFRLRRLRVAQRVVLGDGQRDIVAHAAEVRRDFEILHEYVEDAMRRVDARLDDVERRLDGAISRSALVRYDAYGEMSGRQSTTIALLDDTRSGVILSSIHHRDSARLYAKRLTHGEAEIALSPEEEEAVRTALGQRPGAAAA
jgi:Protein of unknown function (DUF4446)